MMKKRGFYIGMMLCLFSAGAFAQGNEIDAYTLSTPELNGSARYMSMGGAFGALGGDMSVMSHNPAGLGIYRSSEVAGTLDLSMNNTNANWSGLKRDGDKTTFNMNNIGFEFYFPTSNTSGIRNVNIGFSYNRLKNYNRRYTMESNGQDFSMADYVANKASNAFGVGDGITKDELTYEKGSYDPYDNSDLSDKWISILGYEGGFFDHYVGGNTDYQSSVGYWNSDKSKWNIMSPNRTMLNVVESGHMDEYNFALGMNVSNFLFLGASVSVTDMDYKYSSVYDELFDRESDNKQDNLYLRNWLNTRGSAASINVGAIMNLQMIRLGVAYNSPRWYDMTDYADAAAGTTLYDYATPQMESLTPSDQSWEYKFHTPGRWIFSGALILGQSALISADYELMNYRKMGYKDMDGYDLTTNDYIDQDFTFSHTLRLGAEIKVTPQFAIRAGYMMQTSPMKTTITSTSDGDETYEVMASGTIPHYTVTSKPINYYTVGIGYRFTPNLYMDIAAIYRYNKSNAYAFSNVYEGDQVVSTPASLETKKTRVALTLGYKF